MANIPIEKESTNWTPWIIGLVLLALAALAIWAFAGDDDVEVEETAAVTIEETEVVEDPELESEELVVGQEIADIRDLKGPIRQAKVLTNFSAQALDGKDLNIDKMRVTRVVGDKTFYVRPQASDKIDREFFVVLDQVLTPKTAVEGRYDVTQGQTLRITGSVQSMKSVEVSDYDLTDNEAKAMRGDDMYIKAQKLDIAS